MCTYTPKHEHASSFYCKENDDTRRRDVFCHLELLLLILKCQLAFAKIMKCDCIPNVKRFLSPCLNQLQSG